MNRILMNIKYKARIQWMMSTWFLVIYPLSMILISYILIKTSVFSETTGSLVYRLWNCIFFLFATSTKFKEDFDYLLTMSNTRKEIFSSFVSVMFGFSVFFSGLIIFEKILVDRLNYAFGFFNIVDPFHFVAPYASGNVALQFIFFLTFCFVSSIFGLLLGSLFYRFGRKFIVAFWIIFSAIPVVFFPIYLWILHRQGELAIAMKNMGSFFRYFDLLNASGTLLLLSVIFGLAAWVNIRRLPQN